MSILPNAQSRKLKRPRPDLDEIDASVLTMPVEGHGLAGPRFEDQLSADGTLVVFLRHLGCSFCLEMIEGIRAASEARSDYPSALFIHHGSVAQGEVLFAAKSREGKIPLRAIADPQRKLFGAFKIERGNPLQLLGPAVLIRGAAALMKGYFAKAPKSDPLIMPGLFYVKGRRVLWQHRFRHIADHPDFLTLPDLLP